MHVREVINNLHTLRKIASFFLRIAGILLPVKNALPPVNLKVSNIDLCQFLLLDFVIF